MKKEEISRIVREHIEGSEIEPHVVIMETDNSIKLGKG